MFKRHSILRTDKAENPILIIGKVHEGNILGKFDDREEFEVLCNEVAVLEKINLK